MQRQSFRLLLLLLGTLGLAAAVEGSPIMADIHGNYSVSFDAKTNVQADGPVAARSIALNTNIPLVATSASGYSGMDIYGALHRNQKGLWGVSQQAGSGMKLRFNAGDFNHNATALFLVKTDVLALTPSSVATMSAEIKISQLHRFGHASIRFVVCDGGNFYISSASTDYADRQGGKGIAIRSFATDIKDIQWFMYDPEHVAASVSRVGDKAEPSFAAIRFVGFALFGRSIANGESAASNFGVTRFTFALEHIPPTMSSATVHINATRQMIEGFGASAAWYAKGLLSRSYAPEVIDLLFEGLKLDILRLRNVYDHENYEDEIASVAALVAAGESTIKGKVKILMSGWSPPVDLKSNNQMKNGGTLKKSALGTYRYEDYGQWWADSVEYYSSMGIDVDYLSFQNEPDYLAPHESCLFSPQETPTKAGYNKAFEAVYGVLEERMGAGAMPKMLGPETFNLNNAGEYIDNLTELSHVYGFATHYYQQDVGINPNVLNAKMKDMSRKYGYKPLFQTEYAYLNENRNDSIGRKLNLATLMHNALTVEQVSVYNYWGLFWAGEQGLIDIKNVTTPTITPEYFAFKHFSGFVHSDWLRIKVSILSPELLMSAYISPTGREMAVVIINNAKGSVELDMEFEGRQVIGGNVYRSSSVEDCIHVGSYDVGRSTFLMYGRTIVSLSLQLESVSFCQICNLYGRNCNACQS